MRSRVWQHISGLFLYHSGLMVATIVVLTGTFLVAGGVFLLGRNLNQVLTLWGDNLQMSIYLKEDATNEQAEDLKIKLKSDWRVGEAKWIDRQTALTSFQTQISSYAPDLLKDAELLKFIPQSFQVQLSQSVGPAAQLETLQKLAAEFGQNEAVEEVSYGQEWVKTYSSIVGLVTRVGTWLVVLLFVASLFVIANSISSSIQQRKNEIEILELVGASKWFIRVPFLAEGLVLGFVAGSLGLAALAMAFYSLQAQFSHQLAFLRVSEHMTFFSASQSALFVISGTGAGALSAYLSLRRLNDGWSASRRQESV